MGNMSYCRFENTLRDLQDCYENMDNDLSNSEKLAHDRMIVLCRRIAEEFELD
uniref:Uncharacterized protein n=1 Tax=viral metagenome TaxID=1070528 RepID=A0A6H1ZNE8_9ZZZZ